MDRPPPDDRELEPEPWRGDLHPDESEQGEWPDWEDDAGPEYWLYRRDAEDGSRGPKDRYRPGC